MPTLEEQIDAMAGQLEKSTQSPKERLLSTIKELGAEGLKARLLAKSDNGEFLLSEDDRVVLKDALEEMNKAKAVEMDDSYHVGYHQGDVYNKTVIQEDKADDDADEKLVKPEAARHQHQGDSTPGAFEGQVIKGKEPIDIAGDAEETADEAVGKVEKKKMKKSEAELALEEVMKSDDMMYKMIYKMCGCGYEKSKMMDKCVAKGMDKEKVSGMIDRAMAEHKKKEHGKDDMEKGRGPDKSPRKKPGSVGEMMDDPKYQAKRKELYAKLGKPDMAKMKKALVNIDGMDITDEEKTLMKGKIKELLIEAEQSKDDLDSLQSESSEGDKKRPEALKVEKENKEAQDSVDKLDQGKMKKSMDWNGKNLFSSTQLGRNHSFSVNGYYDEAIAKSEAEGKDGGTAGDLKKSDSEDAKLDVNDWIEKGMDMSRNDVVMADSLVKSDAERKAGGGKFVKSFEENEIAAALGLSEEEAKKILG